MNQVRMKLIAAATLLVSTLLQALPALADVISPGLGTDATGCAGWLHTLLHWLH